MTQITKEYLESSKATWLERIMYSQFLQTDFLKTGINGFVTCDCNTAYMPLKLTLDNYGFLDSDIVTLNGSNKPLPITLSPSSQELYSRICKTNQMPANQFATMVAKIINDSMRFEFSILLNKHKIDGTTNDVEYYQAAKRDYVAPADATLAGICSDAGYFIRKIMFNRGTQLPYWISQGSLKDNDSSSLPSLRLHDVTIFFSDKRWILINSLSPTNPKYILEKDELVNKTLVHQSLSLVDKVERSR